MSLVPNYLRDPHAVLFVFDLSSTPSSTQSPSPSVPSRSGCSCFVNIKVGRRCASSAVTNLTSQSTSVSRQAGG